MRLGNVTTEKVAVFVACGSNKPHDRAVSWKLYDSTLFEKSWTAAQALGHPFVMSAKHGIVPPTKRLDKYNETLKGKPKRKKISWADELWTTFINSGYEHYVLLGGRDYVDPLLETFHGPFSTPDPNNATVHDPYEPTSGNGQQMAVAGELADAAYSADTVEQAIEYAQKVLE